MRIKKIKKRNKNNRSQNKIKKLRVRMASYKNKRLKGQRKKSKSLKPKL